MAMLPDKEVKKIFKKEASENPEKYYPTKYLESQGFERKKCNCCGMFFWTVNKNQEHCGDPSCSGGFKVTSDNPAKVKLSYVDVWKKIVEMLEPKKYLPVKRYPVVARWNPTADFVMASIAAFQPFVVSGEVKPPSEKLIIPQFSLRFGDVDNVGITGSHLTGFVMIGQHVFVDESKWNQEEFFRDIYEFLTIGIDLAKEEITIHEDAWAGGGSYGPCMEFFSRGVELFNQVYTMFEQTLDGDRPLKLKVLDMGLGMERIAWFSQGTPNIYEATFPKVLAKIREITKVEMDHKLYKEFSPYSAFLNVDEVENIDEAWNNVAEKMQMKASELKQKIMPMTAIYSIAEHARALLVAIGDGALPSNVGGGYNLRVIFRRAQSFIDQFDWDINLEDVAKWHSEELEEIFPELKENVKNVQKILAVEKQKYDASKQKARSIVERIIEKEEITTEKLLELYDSNGINPEVIKQEALNLGKKVVVPDNFYALVSELHEKKEQIHATQRELPINISKEDEKQGTEAIYFEDHELLEFDANVKYVEGDNNQYVILDKTAFYPTSGGQMHDIGRIQNENDSFKVIDVVKQGKIIVHIMPDNNLKVGDKVKGVIDKNQRQQLTQHHTATHIINAAARKVLGSHVNQIGAKKTIEKATLDITHYESLSDDQLKEIEEEANKIVDSKIKIKKSFMTRDQAEAKYGLNIYQGGAIPGNDLRIVLISNDDEATAENNPEKIVDVECCAGTHLDNTSQTGKIKILKSNKISDGVVRLTYVAGEKAEEQEKGSENLVENVTKALNCEPNQVPARAQELFSNWKKAKKAVKKKKELEEKWFTLSSTEEFDGSSEEALKEAAKILSTQSEVILNTINKFKKDLDNWKSS